MPNFKKAQEPIEISQLLSENSKDNPFLHLTNEIHKRKQLEIILGKALQQLGLEQFIAHISLGEVSLDGEIKLITQKAGVVSKLKNKLPSLLHYFRESGFPLKIIHLKVSPKPTQVDVSQNPARSEITPILFNQEHKQAWQKLLEDIDPQSPVYSAVKQLLDKIN
jgi:hypothetical protein